MSACTPASVCVCVCVRRCWEDKPSDGVGKGPGNQSVCVSSLNDSLSLG